MLVIKNKSFKDITSFRIGGKIRNLYIPITIKDLREVFNIVKNEEYFLVGAGTNILASDRDFEHVISMRKFRRDLEFQGSHLNAYAGCSVKSAALECASKGLSGMEFLIGVPGLIGGAIAMNAGYFGHDISQRLNEITFLTVDGELLSITDFR
ncbi:unnamed protein product, partial [marine sediment metagenome]